jgi:predicted RNA binding protein YcfA (HicA-like mRNA interferase family)
VKTLSGKEFARLLESNGWSLQRINGSHHIYAKAASPVRISVPSTAIHRSRPGFTATL